MPRIIYVRFALDDDDHDEGWLDDALSAFGEVHEDVSYEVLENSEEIEEMFGEPDEEEDGDVNGADPA